MLQEGNGRVKVFARIRPTAKFAQDMIELLPDGKSINIRCKKDLRRGYINNQILDWKFHLDGVLHNTSQSDVFDECAEDIVTKALTGYNGTILAYGQTGAGKTFTMTGSTEKFQHRGIIPRAIQQIFREIREMREHSISVRISYLEIYNERMFDLLGSLPGVPPTDPSLMAVTEDDDGYTRVKGLSVHQANSEEEALNLLFEVRGKESLTMKGTESAYIDCILGNQMGKSRWGGVGVKLSATDEGNFFFPFIIRWEKFFGSSNSCLILLPTGSQKPTNFEYSYTAILSENTRFQ